MKTKALLIIILLATTWQLTAQKLPSFTHDADSVLSHLNKSYITTGILYDRVYPSAMLHVFNTSLSDTTNVHHFKQAYYELYNASYNKQTLLSPEAVDKRMKAISADSKVPIGIMNFKFNQVDTNAVVNHLIENRNGIFYDVANRNPYWKKQVSIISPLTDSIEGLEVSFQTSPALFLQNTGNAIASLKADFNNGRGLINIGLNNSITASYTSYGQKIIKFIIKYQDNTQVATYARLKLVMKKISASRSVATTCDKDGYITASIPFTDYENNTFKGQGNIHYYFSTSTPCNGKVKKPIIILDGFDPGDKRSISQLYDMYLNNADRYRFCDTMRSKGYDIVVLNFPEYTNELGKAVDGGADYIERNAFVLVTLINQLNQEMKDNGSTEKLVIIGPSMGGLISRYALAWMEKNNQPHNTRLWFSLDSPHGGANIPIGSQKYIEFFANNGNKGAQETLDSQLNNPAAKEQLLHHYLSYSDEAKGAPGFRDRFAQSLANNGVAGSGGFPVIPRKISLVDGSLNGSLLPNAAACQMVLNSKSYLTVNLFLFKVQLFRVADASVYFAGSYGNSCTVLTASQLFKSSVTAKGYAQPASVSYDIAPGGSRSSFTTLADQSKGYSAFFQFLIELGKYNDFSVYNGSHSFVPTKSALAFTGANHDFAESVYERNLVCTGETPFNTYYGGTVNLEHSYIDSAMAHFAIDEITGTLREPSYLSSLPAVNIAGPDTFCDPGGIYSVQGANILPGTNFSWSVSPAIATVSGGNAAQVQLTKISNGAATLSLQLSKACGINQKITKSFSISGYNSSDYPVSGPASANNSQSVTFTTNKLAGATNYNWSWPADWSYISGQGTNSIALRTGNVSGYVGVSVANACAPESSAATMYVRVKNNTFTLNVSPNPTTSNITIKTTQSQILKHDASQQDKIYKLEVLDIFGNIKGKFSYSSGETIIKMNVSTLANGTYFIHAYNGTAWTYQKIIVAR